MGESHMSLAQELIEISLNQAMERYYENPSRETFHQILDHLVRAYVFNLTVTFPIEIGDTGGHYKLFETPDYGYAYCVYTKNGTNPDLKESEMQGFIPWRSILSKAIEDNVSTGIVINPYSGHQALVWINPVYIRLIIKNALKTLEDMKRNNEKPDSNSDEEK